MEHEILNDPRFAEIKDFVVTKPEFTSLGKGNVIVRIGRFELLTSFDADFRGTPKQNMPKWNDSTAQVAITFTSAEPEKPGAITHRFNTRGFVRMDDLTEDQLAALKKKYGEVAEDQGYLLVKKDGQLVRAKDEARTKSALNILNSLMYAIGCPEGSGINALKKAREEGSLVGIEVVGEIVPGTDREVLKVAPRFRSVSKETYEKLSGGEDKEFD